MFIEIYGTILSYIVIVKLSNQSQIKKVINSQFIIRLSFSNL